MAPGTCGAAPCGASAAIYDWRRRTATGTPRGVVGMQEGGSPLGEKGKKSGRGFNGIVQQDGGNNRVVMRGTSGKEWEGRDGEDGWKSDKGGIRV